MPSHAMAIDRSVRTECTRFLTFMLAVLLCAAGFCSSARADGTEDSQLMTGACCFFQSMECLEIAAPACANQGGIFLGVGTKCRDGGCVLGGCCIENAPAFTAGKKGDPEGICLLTVKGLCDANGGFFLGEGSNCDGADCQLAPCCLPNGSCFELFAASCLEEGGEPQLSPGATCDRVICELKGPFGGCCFCEGPEPGCVLLSEALCTKAGGVYLGDDVLCASACEELCDPGPGFACCLPNGNCVQFLDDDGASVEECLSMGGLLGELGSICAETECPQDPCDLPGRPDPNDPLSGERVLRGFIVGYAVDFSGNEIRWNHLSAGATAVDYLNNSAMEYPAATFTADGAAHGGVLPDTGNLRLDGLKYASAPQMLLMSFAADGSTAFSNSSASLTSSTELTLMPLDISFHDGASPPSTKAEFQIWNENEVKFSGAYRCVTCWDSTWFEHYTSPNHLLVTTLQTDRGKARIEGVASPLCPESSAHAMIGVQTRTLHSDMDVRTHTGSILTSVGLRSATIQVPITAPPPESPQSLSAPGKQRPVMNAATASAPAGERAPLDDAPVQAMGGALTPRMGTDKGSLFVIPRIEIRWNQQGYIIRDTFVHLTNDFPSDVRVQMWFVNGDPDGFDIYGCPHKGWNAVDVLINLTQDQPIWWSAVTGQPAGVSPFTVLDP